ncbi:MAG: phosphatase PAP2 family protein [Pyrinomonadaceae bacterium]|nr:phosphatase PAP2 family protein [Sphingobacteriaceae bacterium]
MSPYRKRILFYVLGAITMGFIILTFLVSSFPFSMVDREFSEELQAHQYPILDRLMKYISVFGYMPYSIIIVALTALLFFLFKYKKEALYVSLTLLSGLVSALMKIIVARPRPTESLVRIVEKAKSNSFPSGHVIHYVAFFGFILLLMYHLKTIPKALRVIAGSISFFMILTVPLSRIYLGAHWFTDVLGGFFLGMICLLLLSYLYLRKPV